MRVRYLLERGRTFNSAGAPERAVPLFAEALSLAECNDDAFYAVDAAHMLGIAAPPADRLDWNLKALAMAEKAADRARAALARLALQQHRLDAITSAATTRRRSAYFAQGAAARTKRAAIRRDVRIARWIGRARAALARPARRSRGDPARRSLPSTTKLGTPDGYVYEELAEIALARGDAAAAKPWAAKAHAVLKDDPDFAASEAPRLARLARSRRARRPARGSRESAKAPRDLRAAARRQSAPDHRSSSTGRRSSCWSPSCSPRRRPTRASTRRPPKLFPVANTPAAIAKLGVDGLIPYVQSIGLYRNKAKNIVALSEILLREHGGEVPRDREALEALPGVGRKTANVVLNIAFGAADDRRRHAHLPRRQSHRARARQGRPTRSSGSC